MTTMFAELSGARVTEATIVIPRVGAPHARVVVDKEVVFPSTGLSLVLAGLVMTCALARPCRPFQGTTRVVLVAGAGGWGKTVEAKGYASSGGVRASLVLGDLAREVGEKIAVGDDRTLGEAYTRESEVASVHLNTISPFGWWIDLDGTTRTGADRPSSAIGSPFTITSYDGHREACIVATEKPEDFVPGRTFQGATFSSALTINAVSHVLSRGSLRTEVLA